MSLLFVVVLLVVAWLVFKVHLQGFLKQGKAGRIKLGLIAVGIIFLVLAVTGRAPALFAILGAAMTQVVRLAPLLLRYAPNLRRFLGSAKMGGSANQSNGTSRVSTATIDMSLDQSSGRIDGVVKSGPCAGASLSQLSVEQLQSVHAYCLLNDTEALRLLQSYVTKERTEEWEEPKGGSGDYSGNASTGGVMSMKEAQEILGVGDTASREDIIQAHRSLMSRLHPDKGGSNYLAAKVNTAKQCLLERLKA